MIELAKVLDWFDGKLDDPDKAIVAEVELGLGPLHTVLTVQYAAPAAYSLRWKTPVAAELGIDTAPGHRGLHTGPQHLHLADGRVVDDPLTRPDLPPWQNLRTVIDVLLEDPLLASILVT